MHNFSALLAASAIGIGMVEGLNPKLLGDSKNPPPGPAPGRQVANFHPGEPALRHVTAKQHHQHQQPGEGGGGLGAGFLGKFLRNQDVDAIVGEFLHVQLPSAL